MKKTPGAAFLENLELKRLSEAPILKLIELMNHPKVRAQMPLAKEHFDERDCREFIKQKDALWKEHGYGPGHSLLITTL